MKTRYMAPWAIATLATVLWASAALAEVRYTVTDLGTLGAGQSVAKDINDAGQVAGWSNVASGSYHTFRYSEGVMSDVAAYHPASRGWGINSAGQVVGDVDQTAALFSGGGVTHLGTLGGNQSIAQDINDSGLIVGHSFLAGDKVIHGFTYSGGAMQDLGTLGGSGSRAEAVNNTGQIVGSADTAGGVSHAFADEDGGMTDLGTLGGNLSWAYGINDRGQVVGQAETASGITHAFFYSDGVMTDLGTLGGAHAGAEAINEAGVIVGFSYLNDQPGYHAMVYSNGVMADLNTLIAPLLGWTLIEAVGINDSGQIVVNGIDGEFIGGTLTGNYRAFLLTPIPEPATLSLLALGGLLALRRRR
ncbi:MAG: PEP-CTERM sorting domain-containing protein [Planctomycetota bacterium]|nr:PEP-CTERM sorting domain-containing protein [Planctomycetota bacterium]